LGGIYNDVGMNMEIDIEAVIAQAKFEISEMAGRVLLANGAYAVLKKQFDEQAKELAELKKESPAAE
jgi:VIT1/CCC1 family predicted Fe2+/Mn2+ transporter